MPTLSKFAAAQLEGGQVAVVGLHVADCERCRGVLATLAGQPLGVELDSRKTDLSAASLKPPPAIARGPTTSEALEALKPDPRMRIIFFAGVTAVVIAVVAAVIWGSS